MSINPKISIIIPVYNSGKYLKKCLDSIRFQTYENLEIICVNDGSTDNCAEILEEYEAKDSRILVYNQENSGTSAARNFGLSIATGDWISFIDSDDWVFLTLYGDFVDYLEKSGAEIDIFMFNVKGYHQGQNDVIPRTFFDISEWKGHTSDLTIHTFDDCMKPFSRNLSAANKIYRREFLKKNNLKFVENLKYEDQVFSVSAFLKADSILITTDIYYRYRGGTGISSSNVVTAQVFDIFRCVDLIADAVNEAGAYESYKYALFQYKYNVYVQHYAYCPENLRERYYKEMKTRLIETAQYGNINPAIYTKLRNYPVFEVIKNNTREGFEKLVKRG